MRPWETALSGLNLSGFSVRETSIPPYDAQTVARCRRMCEDNLCGKYGTNWACPPGFDEHMDTLAEGFSSALLVSRTFPCDPHDEGKVQEFNTLMKTTVRGILSRLRDAGIGCRGFSDGGCDICPECTYPEPCRHPDLVLPSVSIVGIDMESYLASVGETFEFRDDAVTFYGVILIA